VLHPYPKLDDAQSTLPLVLDGPMFRGHASTPDECRALWTLLGYGLSQVHGDTKPMPFIEPDLFFNGLRRWETTGSCQHVNWHQLVLTLLPLLQMDAVNVMCRREAVTEGVTSPPPRSPQ
jgi:hypothetical protein